MMHSFLLIGQSNMAGRGFLHEARDIDTTRIRIARNGRWVQMFRPINCDRPFSGVNLAESFAECCAKVYDVDVGLIPCADGGTSLEQWMPGSILYDNAVNCCRLAQRSSQIMGILWHQGESDIPEERCRTYQARFMQFITALRRDAGLGDIPVLIGGLGDFLADCQLGDPEENKTYYTMNAVLAAIADADDSIGFVSAEGLGANPDNLHFNADALYEFGIRYFRVYEQMRGCRTPAPDTAPSSQPEMTALERL